MLRFSNLIPRRHPGGFPKLYFDMKFWNFSKFSKKIQNFQTKIELRGASWRPPGFQIWKKEHLSFHWKKNYPSILFRKNFRFCNVSSIKESVGTDFQMCYIVVFSALFERKSKLQTKIQLQKDSWRPPGFQIWKKQYHSFHWKKIILVSVYLNLKNWSFAMYLSSEWGTAPIFRDAIMISVVFSTKSISSRIFVFTNFYFFQKKR